MLKKNIVLLVFVSMSIFLISMNSKNNDLTVGISIKKPTAESAFDGEISVDVTGGVAPYYMTVVSNTSFASQSFKDIKNEQLQNLSKGDYLITVTDSKNNKFFKAIELY